MTWDQKCLVFSGGPGETPTPKERTNAQLYSHTIMAFAKQRQECWEASACTSHPKNCWCICTERLCVLPCMLKLATFEANHSKVCQTPGVPSIKQQIWICYPQLNSWIVFTLQCFLRYCSLYFSTTRTTCTCLLSFGLHFNLGMLLFLISATSNLMDLWAL